MELYNTEDTKPRVVMSIHKCFADEWHHQADKVIDPHVEIVGRGIAPERELG